MKRLTILSLSILTLVAFSSLSARPGQSKKNIKVLTGMSEAEITQAMQDWTKALGTKCSYCHTLGDYASDENEKKEIARKMAQMVRTINRDFLKGEKKASCVLCHRGNTVPETGN